MHTVVVNLQNEEYLRFQCDEKHMNYEINLRCHRQKPYMYMLQVQIMLS